MWRRSDDKDRRWQRASCEILRRFLRPIDSQWKGRTKYRRWRGGWEGFFLDFRGWAPLRLWSGICLIHTSVQLIRPGNQFWQPSGRPLPADLNGLATDVTSLAAFCRVEFIPSTHANHLGQTPDYDVNGRWQGRNIFPTKLCSSQLTPNGAYILRQSQLRNWLTVVKRVR